MCDDSVSLPSCSGRPPDRIGSGVETTLRQRRQLGRFSAAGPPAGTHRGARYPSLSGPVARHPGPGRVATTTGHAGTMAARCEHASGSSECRTGSLDSWSCRPGSRHPGSWPDPCSSWHDAPACRGRVEPGTLHVCDGSYDHESTLNRHFGQRALSEGPSGPIPPVEGGNI
jgi:hypothetical protein